MKAQAQAPAWEMAVAASASTLSISHVQATATDSGGNVYLVGTFSGTVSFGSISLSSFISQDIFVAKWSPTSGSFIWAQRIGGSSDDRATGVSVSGTSVYVVGGFASPTMSVGSSTLTRAGLESVFVAKFTTTGGAVWAQQAGGTGTDWATAVAVSGSDVYVTGNFDSTVSQFGTTTLNNPSGRYEADIFVTKLTDAGASAAFVWAYKAGGTNADEANSIAVSGASVYIAGSVLGYSAGFGSITLPIDGSNNAFVAKLTDAGGSAGFTWVRKVDATLATATAVAANGTSIYVAGHFLDLTARFDGHILSYSSNTDNCFVAKLIDAGNSAGFVWALPANGIYTGDIGGLAVSGTAVYVSGGFSRTGTFGTINLSGSNLTSGAPDVFLAKITDAGTTADFVWARAGGGQSIDFATSVAISGTSVYVGGHSMPTANFSGHVLTGPFGSNGSALLAGLTDPTLNAPAPTLTSFSPASGVNGDVVTLTGTNLTGTTLIAFAGSSRNLVSSGFTVNAAGTQLTGVVVPAGAVTGPLSVTTAGGTATSTTSFVVNTAQLAVSQNGTAYPPQSLAYEFGNQTINTASATSVFTLSNPGATALLVGGASTTGDFAVVGTPTASVPPGGTGSVAIAFRPTTAGGRAGTLVITSTAAGYPTYTVNLSGNGILPVPVALSLTPNSGPIGSVVSLTGTGLTNASRVTFSGTGNNLVTGGFAVNASGTQITNIVVPPGAATGPVTVTTPGGVSSGTPFTVTIPLPTLTSISPDNGPAGTTITATGTNLSGATALTFAGGASATFTVLNSTTVRAVVPVAATSGPVTLTTPFGTSNGVAFTVPPVIQYLNPSSADVGQVVTVQATIGNSTVTGITLNGVSVPFAITNLGALTFTVPAGAASGFVTITTTAGISNGVAFIVRGSVTLTSIAPLSASPGSSVSLQGANLRGVSGIVFAGSGLNTVMSGYTVNAAGTEITGIVVPSGARTGGVTVLSTLGFVNSVNFTVNGTPSAIVPAWQTAASIAATYGGASAVTAMTADASGNVFVAGNFEGTLTLGANSLVSQGNTTAFVAKWSPASSRFVWAVAAGGVGYSSYTYINALAVSGSNVYAAGAISGYTTQFGSTSLTNAGPPLSQDAFVAKLTDAGTTGTFVWAQRAGGTNSDYGAAIAVEGANVYLAGSFGYSIYSNTPGTAQFGTTMLASAGSADAFVAKLTDTGSAGAFAWVQRAGGIQRDVVNGVAVNNGAVYVVGSFESQVAEFGSLTLASRGASDGFIGKLTDAGTSASFGWVQPVGSYATDAVQAVAVSGASLYVTGTFSGPVAFGNTTLTFETWNIDTDVFVAKLTDMGNAASFAWALPAASVGSDEVSTLALNGTSIYIAGRFWDKMHFGNRTLTSAGDYDVFVAKVVDGGGGGSLAWARQAGGLGSDRAQALAVSGNSVYVGGTTYPPSLFDALTIPNPAPNVSATMGFLASITSQQLSAKSPLASREGLGLYPNPAHGTVTAHVATVVSPTRVAITLTDALGRVVRSQENALAAGNQTVELSLQGLPSGVYTVRVKTNTGMVVQRLMVK